MKELKNQPIDKRTKKQYYIRLLLIVLFYAIAVVASFYLVPWITEKYDIAKHTRRIIIIAVAVLAMAFVRSLYRNNIRKWCFAYITYVYDCMMRDDTMNCPRCNSAFGVDYSNPGKAKECENKNCGMSLNDKIGYDKLPATLYGAKALVLNGGIRDDFKYSFVRNVCQHLIAIAVYIGVSAFAVYFIAPQIIRLIDFIKDM